MILFFGVQGSGKSAQGQLLTERQGWTWLSTGQLFRETDDAEIKKMLAAGRLVSDEMTERMLGRALSQVQDTSKLVLDGFPRTVSQAEWLLDHADGSGKFSLDGVFNLVASKEVAHERLLKRGRDDDTEASIAERLELYRRLTLPILDYLKKENIKIVDINADPPIEAVHKQIVAELKLLTKAG